MPSSVPTFNQEDDQLATMGTSPVASMDATETPEPGGPGQSLPAAGILAMCAASFSPSPGWLRSYLSRALSASSGLQLLDGARTALIEQALEVCISPDASHNAVDAVHGYLSASAFAPEQAVPIVAAFLQADVISTTVYDARARETLLRFTTALRLPPRVLYEAEAELAALVRALADNARTSESDNIEAVSEDGKHARRRKSLKWLKVGAAGVVGGLALGLSGGLIAPALIPALGTVGLASVSAPLTALGSGGAVAVGGLFGAAGAGVGAAAMASRTGVVQEFSFEPCNSLVQSVPRTIYENARISPKRSIHDVVVPWHGDGDEKASGGLLVWEVLTKQEHVMVVPGLISFSVWYSSEDGGDVGTTSLLPEEFMEVGGIDREKVGEGKRRRTTGAVTVQGRGEYTLRFKLMPGSLPVQLSYRVTIVPPGRDPPLWIMEENEQQSQQVITNDIRSLSMAIFIPGLVIASGKNGAYPGMCADQFASTASGLSNYDIQCFALRWDTDLLVELSDALRKLIGRMALSMAAQNGAMMVVPALIGVVGAVALPISIIGALRTLIGNIWARTISHAEECGYMLAAELASRSFGNRPVVLAGYSAGATVVFSCLRELARRKLVGIVHDACLIGAPCTADVATWRECRSVVSGRLINVYNNQDWYLELYHRGTNLGSVAGTRSIDDVKGIANVENIRLDPDFVANHADYANRCGDILLQVGIGDVEKRREWKDLSALDKEVLRWDDELGKRNDGEPFADETGHNSNGAANDCDDDDDDDVILFNDLGRRRRSSWRRASRTASANASASD